MALQWVLLGCIAGFEAVLLFVLSMPMPISAQRTLVPLYENLLSPLAAVVPFALFQLMEVYWRFEHKVKCVNEICTVAEKDRYEKSFMKTQRNGLLAAAAFICYWILYRFTKTLKRMVELEKELKEEKIE